jgi:hypothetical protein
VTSPYRKRKNDRSRAEDQNRRAREARGGSIGTCPACGKRAFTSRRTVEAHIGLVFPGERKRVYECHDRAGFWHFTSQDAARTEQQRIILARRADGEAAARYTAQVLAGTGAGPTWAELADALGWPADPTLRRLITRDLIGCGWLACTREARSLRPGPSLL